MEQDLKVVIGQWYRVREDSGLGNQVGLILQVTEAHEIEGWYIAYSKDGKYNNNYRAEYLDPVTKLHKALV